MHKPTSFIFFIIAICLTVPGLYFANELFLMPACGIAFTGMLIGLFHRYQQQESRFYNRVGWAGNLFILLLIVCYIIRMLVAFNQLIQQLFSF